jgi:hypothetical protein
MMIMDEPTPSRAISSSQIARLVRASVVAHELLRWRADEVFYILLKAATQRATVGLIESLGDFGARRRRRMDYDMSNHRLLIPGGDGFLGLYGVSDPDHVKQVGRIATRKGARTGLLIPGRHKYVLAAPAAGQDAAQLMVYGRSLKHAVGHQLRAGFDNTVQFFQDSCPLLCVAP